MVLILVYSGSSKHFAHAHEENRSFWKKKKSALLALEFIKCHKQIKWQRLLLKCEHLLPSNMITMGLIAYIDAVKSTSRIRIFTGICLIIIYFVPEI